VVTLTKAERVYLRDHTELDERWLQARIADDPSLLGLGDDLILLNKEVIQPKAGRLDLLLRDPSSTQRYEVEIQLGRTDETHIIRTLEYWDIERKRYPQYEHTAVIVAEDITSRFLNVISLFNGFIPLVAIQVAALRVGNHLTLQFTKVLDQVRLGDVDADLEVQQPATRADWDGRSTKEVMALVDELQVIVKALDSDFDLKYNKHFIGLARDGKPDNFVVLQPRKQWLRLAISLTPSDESAAEFEKAGLKAEFDSRWRRYVINLEPGDVKKAKGTIEASFKRALDEWR